MNVFRLVLSFLICCLLLAGCDIQSLPDPLAALKEAELITVSDGIQLFTLELTQGGGIFRFSSPELLQKLTVEYDGNAFYAAYDGLETEVAGTFLRDVFPLYEAVCAFRTAEAERESENILSVSLDGRTFLLYYDSEGGVITRLEVKGADGTKGFDVLSCIKKDDNAKSSRTD